MPAVLSVADKSEAHGDNAKQKCDACGDLFEVDDLQPRGRNGKICNKCNSFRSKLQRLDCEQNHALKDLNKEEWEEFKEQSRGLCGAQLAKLICETVMMSSMRKSSWSKKAHGDMELKDDLEKKYADKPDIWANIQKNAVQVTHPVTQEVFLWVPKLSMEIAEEQENFEQRKRVIECEDKVRPKKMPRTNRRNQEIQEEPEEDGAEPKLLDINTVVADKLAKKVLQMQTLHLELVKTQTALHKPEIQDNLPPTSFRAYGQRVVVLKDVMDRAEAIAQDKKAAKGGVASLTKEIAKAVNECKESLKEVNASIKRVEA